MYPLGVLFGFGFDTSSEVALLGISSIQTTQGTSIWVILIFPILFTGMPALSYTQRNCKPRLTVFQPACASSTQSTARSC